MNREMEISRLICGFVILVFVASLMPIEAYSLKKADKMLTKSEKKTSTVPVVDIENSDFRWMGRKVTGEHYGKIKVKSADVKIEDGYVRSGEIVMDMSSITVEDIENPNRAKKFLGHMKSADFFDVENNDDPKLVIQSGNKKMISGEMIIKGKKQPFECPIKPSFSKELDYGKKAVACELKYSGAKYMGKMAFDRTKFDMRYKSGNFFKDLGDKAIYDKVELSFTVALK